MKYPEEFIEKVQEANNLREVIESYSQLKGQGDNYMGLCPFPDHKERTASFSVSERKQVYHCFGCGKSGNIFTFLQDYNGMSFPEAVEYLATRASIALPKKENSYQSQGYQDKKKAMAKINALAKEYYISQLANLPKNEGPWKYILQRGLSEETVKEFELGYATENWHGLTQKLYENKAPLKFAEELGLVRKNRNGKYFDLLRERLIFPIHSTQGVAIGFGGRTLTDQTPKYINSSESLLFHKGRSLYGLNESAKYIKAQDSAIIVEGYMDFLALYSRGIKNVVATLGTALTEEHSRLLRRYTPHVVVLFDGDKAGTKAAQKSLKPLLAADLIPKVLVLPDNQDPDDFLNSSGVQAFQNWVLHKSRELFSWELDNQMVGYTPEPGKKVKIVEYFSGILSSMPNQKLKTLYIYELSDRLGLSVDQITKWVRPGLSKFDEKQQNGTQRAKNSGKPAPTAIHQPKPAAQWDISRATKEEIICLGLALKALVLLEYFLSHGGMDCLGDENITQIFKFVEHKYRQEPSKFDRLAALVCSKVGSVSLLTATLQDDRSEDESATWLKDCLLKMKRRKLRKRAQEMAQELSGQPDEQKLRELAEMHRSRLHLDK